MRYRAFLVLIIALLVCLLSCDSSESDNSVNQETECVVNFYSEENLYCTIFVNIGELVSQPTAPQREGYDFVGWYDGTQKWNFAETKLSKDLKLTAKWDINFKSMFPTFTGPELEFAKDGSYLKINATPLDECDGINEAALKRIKEANIKLGLPNDLYQEMISTISADGIRTASNELVTVEWTNSIKDGLCVIYTKIEV